MNLHTALKSILLCTCKLQLSLFFKNVSSCKELYGEHFVVNSYLNYLLAFFSSLENIKGALTICLACLALAQLDLENHVGMWIQSIKFCESRVLSQKCPAAKWYQFQQWCQSIFSERQFLFKSQLFVWHL